MVSLLAMIGVTPAMAIEDIHLHVPQAKKVGKARMSVMFWDVYDATLLAPGGKWSKDKPFALQLTYLRHLDGPKIADRAVQEMRGQGIDDEVKLAIWHTQMRQIFPDVYEGDTLTGVFTKDGETIFYSDNTEIGRIKDVEFTKYFPAIWLSPKTSEPDLRLGLLGGKIQKGQDNYDTQERTVSYGTARMH